MVYDNRSNRLSLSNRSTSPWRDREMNRVVVRIKLKNVYSPSANKANAVLEINVFLLWIKRPQKSFECALKARFHLFKTVDCLRTY